MSKIIRNFNIDLSSLPAVGGNRRFSVEGDTKAIFSLEIKNEDDYYYNFSTRAFSSTKSRLKRKAIQSNGKYTGYINFPAVTDNDQYDIYLWAESSQNTAHIKHSEVKFGDGSIDINSSTGSNSNLLQKVIYQYTDVTVTLSAIAPKTNRATTDFSSMSVSTDTIVMGRGDSIKTPFSIGVTVTATKAVQITTQPTDSSLTAYTTAVFGDAVKIHGEDIFAGAVRDTDTVDGAVSSATKIVMDNNVADKMKVGDRVTGTGISSSSTVTVVALNPDGDNVKEFSVSEAVSISDGVTLTLTPARYYRYNVAAASSIHKLASGMIYIDSQFATVPRTAIGSYSDKTTFTTETVNEDGSVEEVKRTIENVSVPALDPLGHKPTITNGLVTKQLGNITFTEQIINDVDDTNAKLFYAYGPKAIKTMHDVNIKLTDLNVELVTPITTTTSAVNNSATIPVADREGTIVNISTISGIGVGQVNSTDTVDGAIAYTDKLVLDNNVAGQMRVGDRVTGIGIPSSSIVTVKALNPDGDNVKEFSISQKVNSIADGTTLTFIQQSLPVITSSTADGAGSWTVDVAQTLESGATLAVGKSSRTAIITGNIELENVDDTSFTLYFDVEKFLTTS